MAFIYLFVKENDSVKYALLVELGGAYFTPPLFFSISLDFSILSIISRNYPESRIQNPVSRIQYPESNIQYPVSSIPVPSTEKPMEHHPKLCLPISIENFYHKFEILNR